MRSAVAADASTRVYGEGTASAAGSNPPEKGYWERLGLVMDQFDGFCQVGTNITTMPHQT